MPVRVLLDLDLGAMLSLTDLEINFILLAIIRYHS